MADEHCGEGKRSRKDPAPMSREWSRREAARLLREAKSQPKPQPPPIPVNACTIYFIQIGHDGPIKIGRTAGSPLRRLADLQTAIPYDLRVVATINDAAPSVERELHRKFAHLHIRGEWFRPEIELLAEIGARAIRWDYESPPATPIGERRREESIFDRIARAAGSE